MRLALATLFLSACCTSLPKLPDKRLALPSFADEYASVSESRHSWHDAKRKRDVPVTIYTPDAARGRLPVVVFSHGIGEDRDSYAWVGRALARQGFLAMHVTHAGTDRAVLERGYRHLYRAVKVPENWINRPLDVSFVLDQLAGRDDADVGQSAIAGHSAGAFTAFALAGMRNPRGVSFADPRIRVAIPISMPRLGDVVPPGGYDAIDIPVLNLTGTCDVSILYGTFPRHRRIPFEQSRAPRQYLVTIDRANHDSFVIEDRHRDTILRVTIAFLRAWLRGDARARAWFDEQGRHAAISVERKNGSAR